MKLFQPKPVNTKTSQLYAERAELEAIVRAKEKAEAQYRLFLVQKDKEKRELDLALGEKQRSLSSDIASLTQELASLESKRQAIRVALENGEDEKAYKQRYAQFQIAEQALGLERDRLRDATNAIDSDRKTLATLIKEQEAEYSDLMEEVRSKKVILSSKEKELRAREKRIAADEALADVTKKRLDDAMDRAENLATEARAMISANKVFRATLEEEQNALIREKRALKDAYGELERSRNRLLGRNT